MSRDFPVKGLAELDRYLSALPKNMQKAAYRQALTAAARPVRDEARLLAPKATGALAKSIKTGSPRQNQDGTFSVSIRLDGPHDFIGLFHEYGVSPHFITAGGVMNDKGKPMSARMLSKAAKRGDVTGDTTTQALMINGKFITGSVFHPGHASHPFMRPALDAKSDDAVKAFAAKIRAFIEGKTGFSAPLDEAA